VVAGDSPAKWVGGMDSERGPRHPSSRAKLGNSLAQKIKRPQIEAVQDCWHPVKVTSIIVSRLR